MKTHKWLLPVSWLYGLGVGARNLLFDRGVLHSRSYDLPVISVGNLAVGGTGKTPHVEYLIRLLNGQYRIAVLSRGYKRRTHGYVLADDNSTATDIGDEPMQIKSKFGDITVAVDANRCEGLERLMTDPATADTQVVLLDDAFQHRYVKPGLSILLIEFERLVGDCLLPAGRLREPMASRQRADIIVVTKCPEGLSDADFLLAERQLEPKAHQRLYFSAMVYQQLEPVFGGENRQLNDLSPDSPVLLVTGIANPRPLCKELCRHTNVVRHLTYADHHAFSTADISAINEMYALLPGAMVVTTEKDATRLSAATGLSDEVRRNLFQLPIHVGFLNGGGDDFDHQIMEYIGRSLRPQ